MGFHRTIILMLVSVFTFRLQTMQAEDLIGAKAVVKHVEEAASNLVPAEEGHRWTKIIRELPDEMANMEPKEAAATWLQTYSQWLVDTERLQGGTDQSTFADFIDALPSPVAWPELVRQIDARPIVGDEMAELRGLTLRMLGHRLQGQMELLKQDIDQALKLVDRPKQSKKRGFGYFIASLFGGSDQFDRQHPEVRERIQAVREELEPKSAMESFRERLERPEGEMVGYLWVPDLVKLVGSEQATPILEKAILLKSTRLVFSSPRPGEAESETIKIARDLARKHLDEISQPIWSLCHSIDAHDLFEAFWTLKQSLDPQDENRSGSLIAVTWHLLGLVLDERTDDVLTFLIESQANPDEFGALASQFSELIANYNLSTHERTDHSQKVHAFLGQALNEHPELPLWETFISLTSQLGQTRPVLAAINSALDRTNLPEPVKRQLEQVRADLLLAADRVDEGVAAHLTLLDDPNVEAGADWTINRSRQKRAIQIAEIGRLLSRDEWVQRGIDAAEKFLLFETDLGRLELPEAGQDGDVANLVAFLIDLKQWSRAEKLLTELLLRQVANDLENQGEFLGDQPHTVASELLELLLQVYHAAGRSDDVLALLEDAPWWAKRDMTDWLQPDQNVAVPHGKRTKLPIPYIAAKALVSAGRQAEARRIAEAMILLWPGFDPGWQLALELTGDEFEKLAERSYARDRFEERPLIWLARFHLDQGNLRQAEELSRRAIAIDPADAEQVHNDRMRAHAILAEILRKKNDDKAAAVYEAEVTAIRMGEQADEFCAAGLLSRGIEMYSNSLKHFADADDIHSRLAVQLGKSGDMDSAAKHYQRALELMPQSLGRVGSQGFRSEGAFDGVLAENIATRILTRLATEQPKNPQVNYLLGCLLSSQLRYSDAIDSFREATRLDPDYLNAWEKLVSTDDLQGVKLPVEVREEATLQILRLDPLGFHAQAELSNVRDLRRLWTVLDENRRRVPDLSFASTLILKASKRQFDATRNGNVDFEWPREIETNDNGHIKFQSHRALRTIVNLMEPDSDNLSPMARSRPQRMPAF